MDKEAPAKRTIFATTLQPLPPPQTLDLGQTWKHLHKSQEQTHMPLKT